MLYLVFLTNSLVLIAFITFPCMSNLSYAVCFRTLSTTLVILLKPVETVFTLSISDLSTSNFRLDKSTLDLTAPAIILLQLLLHN